MKLQQRRAPGPIVPSQVKVDNILYWKPNNKNGQRKISKRTMDQLSSALNRPLPQGQLDFRQFMKAGDQLDAVLRAIPKANQGDSAAWKFLKHMTLKAANQLSQEQMQKSNALLETSVKQMNQAVDFFYDQEQNQIAGQIRNVVDKTRKTISNNKQYKLKQKQIEQVYKKDLTQEQMQKQVVKLQEDLDKIREQNDQLYKAGLQQVQDLMRDSLVNKKYMTQLNRVTQALNLNNTILQGTLPIYYSSSGTFNRMKDRRPEKWKIDNFDYGSKLTGKYKSRTNNWQQVVVDSKLHTLPHQAPRFMRQLLTRQKQVVDVNANHNTLFQQAFGAIAEELDVQLPDLLANQAYWSKHNPPPGFYFNRDSGVMTIKPDNPAVAMLWPQGIMYKQVPTAPYLNSQLKMLANSHKTALQMRGAYDADVLQMMDGAKALGFNPHFGAISKNGQSLYIGAFVDPMTGRIRLPPKPSLKNYNPVDRDSILEYKVLKAMYTWNSNVKAMQQMRKFMQQTDRGWKSSLKNKRKSANIAQRKRNQYRNIARKIALKLPIYGIRPSDALYKTMANVWQRQGSTPAQLQTSLNNFLKDVSDKYAMQAQTKMNNFRTHSVPLGDIMRSKASFQFNQRPYIDAQKWLQRTTLVPTPLGKTGAKVQQQSIYGKLANTRLGQDKLKVKNMNPSLIFNTKQEMRSNKYYDNFNLENKLHIASNQQWRSLYNQQDPQQALRNTRKIWGKNAFQERDFGTAQSWNVLSSNQRKHIQNQNKRQLAAIKDYMQVVKLSSNQINDFLVKQGMTMSQANQVIQSMKDHWSVDGDWDLVLEVLRKYFSQIPQRSLEAAWHLSHGNGQELLDSSFIAAFTNFLFGQSSASGISTRTRSRYRYRPSNDPAQQYVRQQIRPKYQNRRFKLK